MNLAEQVESTEANLMFKLTELPEPLLTKLGITGRRFGRGIALSVRNDPSLFWSRVQGFGFDEPVTGELVGEVLDFFRAAGTPATNFHLPPEVLPADWAEICQAHGLTKGPTLVKLVRDRSPAEPVATSLRVGPIAVEDREAWAAVQIECFEMPDPDGMLAEMLALINDVPGVTGYAAWDGDKLVATAALSVDGEVGEFVSASTLPEYRGRGAQSALLARRTEDAVAAGCRWLGAETGKPAEGESNPSLDNLQRAGFKILYNRPIWTWTA
jgi:GNAT superfamily N-acetyltransferase